jgi:hypothetical protein
VNTVLTITKKLKSLTEFLEEKNARMALTRALREFRILRFDIESLSIFGIDFFKSCPACPPGTCSVAIDGNFRLGRLHNASKNDSYENLGIQFYLLDAESTREAASTSAEKISDAECSNFQAGGANRGSSAFDEKGLFGAYCARHEVPLVFAHVFHGERYSYPDLVLREVFDRHQVNQATIFYDISCNYLKHVKVPFNCYDKRKDNLIMNRKINFLVTYP